MFRIGLTGGIGSGKSTVCRLFSGLGVTIIDADQISRELVEPGTPGLDMLVARFGKGILTSSGRLDRARLRAMIFSEPVIRQQLEGILHPLIRQRMIELADSARGPYVVLAIPLLLESGWQQMVDRILVVDCPIEQQLSRTMARDGLPREQVEAIIASQIDRQHRRQQAHDIIDNDHEQSFLQEEVKQLHQRYLQLAKQTGR